MSKTPLIYRLYLRIKCNRPITDADGTPCFGSIEIITKRKTFQIDFTDITGYREIDDSPDVLYIEMKNPNYDDFPDCNHISKSDMKNVTSIGDVYVDIDENSDFDVLNIIDAAFILPYEDFQQIDISEEACAKASFCA